MQAASEQQIDSSFQPSLFIFSFIVLVVLGYLITLTTVAGVFCDFD